MFRKCTIPIACQFHRNPLSLKSLNAIVTQNCGHETRCRDGLLPFPNSAAKARPFVSSSRPTVASFRQDLRSLKKKTKQWLRIPYQEWTPKEVSLGRFLMHSWKNIESSLDSRGHMSKTASEAAMNQSRILQRWIQVRSSLSPIDKNVSFMEPIHYEFVQMLHQCLDSWKLLASTFTHQMDEYNPAHEAYQLLCLLDDLGISTGIQQIRPDDKAYSMCLTVIAMQVRESGRHQHDLELHGAVDENDVNTYYQYCQHLWKRRMDASSKPDLRFYNALLHALAKCSMIAPEAPTTAESVLKQCTLYHAPDVSSFVSLMHAWTNRADRESVERAQAILDSLLEQAKKQKSKNTKLFLSPECSNVCIDGWAKVHCPDKAEELLWMMLQLSQQPGDIHKHWKPTVVSFNSAINAWAKCSNNNPHAPNKAEKLLEKMTLLGYSPTLESYTAVLDAWSRTEQPGPRVEAMLDRLEELHAQNPTTTVPPNKFCYVIALRAWAATTKQKDAPLRAEQLVQRMRQLARDVNRKDLEPTEIVYAALLESWSKSARPDAPDRALNVFREVLTCGTLKPTVTSFHQVLNLLATRGRAQEARALLKEMELHHSAIVNQASYDIVMRAFTLSKDRDAAEHAEEYFREMTLHPSINPTTKTYAMAMVAWGNSAIPKAAAKAQDLFWELTRMDKELVPNVITVNCVLRAWAKSQEGGAAKKADAMYQWVEEIGPQYGIEPDATTFLHMIQAWAHSGSNIGPQKAEYYLEKLKEFAFSHEENAFHLTTAHFNRVVMAWSRSTSPDAFERLSNIVDDMLRLAREGHNIKPDKITLRHVNVAISRSNNDLHRIRKANKLKNTIEKMLQG